MSTARAIATTTPTLLARFRDVVRPTEAAAPTQVRRRDADAGAEPMGHAIGLACAMGLMCQPLTNDWSDR